MNIYSRPKEESEPGRSQTADIWPSSLEAVQSQLEWPLVRLLLLLLMLPKLLVVMRTPVIKEDARFKPRNHTLSMKKEKKKRYRLVGTDQDSALAAGTDRE